MTHVSNIQRFAVASIAALIAFIFIAIIPCIPMMNNHVSSNWPLAVVYVEYESTVFQRAVILGHLIASVLIGFAVWRLRASPVLNVTPQKGTFFDEL